jgi:hypothetical protein
MADRSLIFLYHSYEDFQANEEEGLVFCETCGNGLHRKFLLSF